MKLGIISDTHDFLDPRIEKLFDGVEHILHGGDVGMQAIISELEQIAPVTAVLGNTDLNNPLRLTEVVTVAGRNFLVQHIVNPHAPSGPLKTAIARHRPAAVIFGHTHRPFNEVIGGTLFINPGYSGKPQYGTERSVAILHCDESGIRPEYLPL